MKHLPLSIKLNTVLQFLIPVGAMLVDPDPWRSASVFALMPIAGSAIFGVKRWSYPIFASVLVFTAQRYVDCWKIDPRIFHPALLVMILALDALTVAYFLLPVVRQAYIIPKASWWETRPRYELRLSATVVKNMRKSRATIANVSEGGAFIRTSEDLDAKDLIELKFAVLTQDYQLRAVVTYALKGASSGYGIRFEHTPESLERMRKLCYCLEVLDAKKERIEHRIIRHPLVSRLRQKLAA